MMPEASAGAILILCRDHARSTVYGKALSHAGYHVRSRRVVSPGVQNLVSKRMVDAVILNLHPSRHQGHWRLIETLCDPSKPDVKLVGLVEPVLLTTHQRRLLAQADVAVCDPEITPDDLVEVVAEMTVSVQMRLDNASSEEGQGRRYRVPYFRTQSKRGARTAPCSGDEPSDERARSGTQLHFPTTLDAIDWLSDQRRRVLLRRDGSLTERESIVHGLDAQIDALWERRRQELTRSDPCLAYLPDAHFTVMESEGAFALDESSVAAAP